MSLDYRPISYSYAQLKSDFQKFRFFTSDNRLSQAVFYEPLIRHLQSRLVRDIIALSSTSSDNLLSFVYILGIDCYPIALISIDTSRLYHVATIGTLFIKVL